MSRKSKLDYKCEQPPCIHVVFDNKKKLFKIFVEDYNIIIPVPLEKALEACQLIARAGELADNEGYREAWGDDIDYLARKYLNAEPTEEEYTE